MSLSNRYSTLKSSKTVILPSFSQNKSNKIYPTKHIKTLSNV